MSTTVTQITETGKKDQMMDLRFGDPPGDWQHFCIPTQPGDELQIDVADVKHWGPEAEFFLFHDARYNLLANC